MEIPTLSEKERQRMNSGMLVGNNYCTIGFVTQKLGPEGVKEYDDCKPISWRIQRDG